MPIYVYRCAACACEFDKLVRSSREADLVRCPDCEGAELERLPTTFSVGSSAKAAPKSDAPFCGRCGESRPPCDG
jgi:putative FmdB family regulatory protein